MSKKDKRYYDLDEASVTADVVGYLSNKKQVCDPFAQPKKKSKKDDVPWYLASMKDLNESIIKHLSMIKEAVSAEEYMGAIQKLKDQGVDPNHPFIQQAKEMLKRASDKNLPPVERKKYRQFQKTLEKEYGNDLYAYLKDQIQKPKNVEFGEIKKLSPELAQEITQAIDRDFPRLTKHGKTDLPDRFNRWELLPSDLTSKIGELAKNPEAKLKRFAGTRPYSAKGRMKPKAKSKRVQPVARFSPGEVASSRRQPRGKTVMDIQSDLEKEDPHTTPGTAVRSLRNVYGDLADEIMHGKGGHFDFERFLKVKSKEWRDKGVNLPEVYQKYLALQDEVPDTGEEDLLTPLLKREFDKKELAALMDLSEFISSKGIASRALPSDLDVEKYSDIEKGLEPFIKTGLGSDEESSQYEAESSGFVTDEALLTFARIMGVKGGSPDEKKDWAEDFLSRLQNTDAKKYRRIKGTVIKQMKKDGLVKAAKKEAEMDVGRAFSADPEGPVRFKGRDDETVGLGGVFDQPETEDEPDLSMFNKLIRRKQRGEFGAEEAEKSRKLSKQVGRDVAKKKKKEPKTYYGSQRSLERHKKGPGKGELKSYKKELEKEKARQRDPDSTLKALRKKAKKPSSGARYQKPKSGETISKMPTERPPKKPRIQKMPQKQPSMLPRDLSWGLLPQYVQQTVLTKLGRPADANISSNWSRFGSLPKELQQYIASELNIAAESYYPKIKLEMLFNIDGSEEKEKPKKKDWEDAKLAKDVDFAPKFGE